MEEVESLRENFLFSDIDGSGNIDEEELSSLMKNCGCEATTQIQKTALATCLADLDVKGSTRSRDQLSFSETVRVISEYHGNCTKAVMEHWKNKTTENAG